MVAFRKSCLCPKRVEGFSLIEVAIVVAMVGIMASLALSTYSNQILRDCRRDGWSSLEGIANLQELNYFRSHAYADSVAELGAAGTSPNGHYRLETSWIEDNMHSYTVTASPLTESSCVGGDRYSYRLSHLGQREHNGGSGWKPGWDQ